MSDGCCDKDIRQSCLRSSSNIPVVIDQADEFHKELKSQTCDASEGRISRRVSWNTDEMNEIPCSNCKVN